MYILGLRYVDSEMKIISSYKQKFEFRIFLLILYLKNMCRGVKDWQELNNVIYLLH